MYQGYKMENQARQKVIDSIKEYYQVAFGNKKEE